MCFSCQEIGLTLNGERLSSTKEQPRFAGKLNQVDGENAPGLNAAKILSA